MFWKKKNNQKLDERLLKETYKLATKMFYVQSMLMVILFVVKLINNLPFQMVALEILTLLVGIGYALVQEMRKGILFIGKKDDALQSIHEDVLARAYNKEMWCVAVGELIIMYVFPQYFIWTALYLASVFIPALVYTIVSIKRGWIQWGTKRREISSKQELKKRCVWGGIAFGILSLPTNIPMFLKDGEIELLEIIWIPLEMILFGGLFYLIFTFMVDKGAKKADEACPIEEGEMTIEE